MKKRLKEIEEEAGALREMQAKVEKEMGAVQGMCWFFFFFEVI
jgi:polyadenylate-binding protein 2